MTALVPMFVNPGKPSDKKAPGHQTDRISDAYRTAVFAMIEQFRVAQNDRWQKTSRQAALLWNRVIREKILSKEPHHG